MKMVETVSSKTLIKGLDNHSGLNTKLRDVSEQHSRDKAKRRQNPYSVIPTQKYPIQELWQCLAICTLDQGVWFIKVFHKN